LKIKLSIILLILLLACPVWATWTWNPFTDNLDYSGVSVVPYQANPTLPSLRAALIDAGIMEAAPVVTTQASIAFYDSTNTGFYDSNETAFFDF